MKRHPRQGAWLDATLGALLLLTFTPHSATAQAWRARIVPALQSVHDSQQSAGAAARVGARVDAQGRIEADVHHDCAAAAPLAALKAAGLTIHGGAALAPLCVVEGWVSPSALPALAAVSGVTQVTLPSYVRPVARPAARLSGTPAGPRINGNGVSIMRADQFVAQAGGGGTGVLVGVQSQGVASLPVIQGRGELPAQIPDFTGAAGGGASSADEGTALLEEVHAVAPDAQLAFCEPDTFVQYLACLGQFVKAARAAGLLLVTADDIQFLDQDPMSTGGDDAAGVTTFLAQNPDVALFTSAGNDNGSYWEGYYNPVSVASLGVTLPVIQGSGCDPSRDLYVHQFHAGRNQVLTTNTSGTYAPLTFAWQDPPGTHPATSNFDIYWVNPVTAESGCVTTSGTSGPVLSLFGPNRIAVYPGDNIVYIATRDASLAGRFLKLWVGGDGLTALSLPTVGSTVSPQSFATGPIIVGAVNGSDGVGSLIEDFSSLGPVTVLYPTPATLQVPTFVAPDGVAVDASGTYFASYLFPDGNFYGTSAAVPNAAAVAALLRGAFPQLGVPQLVDALKGGAAQLGASVPDGTFGFGRVDAIGSRDLFPGPTLTALADVAIDAGTSTTSAAVPFSVTVTGRLHFTVTSSNPALVPAQVGASGSPGVAVTPADCGSSTQSCSLTVTAADYQGGTAALIVSAVDGAGRAAPQTMTVAVSNPKTAPPPGKKGGGSLALWELLALAGLAGARVLRRS